jgi:hypothetical protein
MFLLQHTIDGMTFNNANNASPPLPLTTKARPQHKATIPHSCTPPLWPFIGPIYPIVALHASVGKSSVSHLQLRPLLELWGSVSKSLLLHANCGTAWGRESRRSLPPSLGLLVCLLFRLTFSCRLLVLPSTICKLQYDQNIQRWGWSYQLAWHPKLFLGQVSGNAKITTGVTIKSDLAWGKGER